MLKEKFYDIFAKGYDCIPTCPYTFGPGCIEGIGKRLAMFQCKKALLVTDPLMRKLGYVDTVAKFLSEAGIEHEIYDDTCVNPTAASVHKAFESMRGRGFDAIVAVGGGSVEDTGKGIKHLCGYPEHKINDIAMGASWKFYPHNTPIKLVTVPTMNGTGCEFSVGAAITSPEGRKDSVVSGNTAPDYAFIDPNFTLTVDSKNTVACACDAIAHAYNKLLMIDGNFYMQKMVNFDVVKILMDVVPRLLKDPKNINYRSAAAIASCLDLRSIPGSAAGDTPLPTQSPTTLALRARITCAQVQPAVFRRYLPKCEATREMTAEMLGLDPSSKDVTEQICQAFIKWYKEVGIPSPAASCDYNTWMSMGDEVTKDSTWWMSGGNYPDDMQKCLNEMYHDFD